MSNVGLMGSTMFEGCSLQQVLQFKSMNYPNPQRLIKCQKVYTRFTTNKIYKDVQQIQDIQETKISHPRAKHAPSGTYSTWTAFTGI